MTKFYIFFNHSKTYHITKIIKYTEQGTIEYRTSDTKNNYIVPLSSVMYIRGVEKHV
jgi:hypothetical protein